MLINANLKWTLCFQKWSAYKNSLCAWSEVLWRAQQCYWSQSWCMTLCFLLDLNQTIFSRMSFLPTFLVLCVFVNGYVLSLKLSFEETNFLQDYIEQKNVEDVVIIIERGLNYWIDAISNMINDHHRINNVSAITVETDSKTKKFKSFSNRISLQVIIIQTIKSQILCNKKGGAKRYLNLDFIEKNRLISIVLNPIKVVVGVVVIVVVIFVKKN